jgi:hypothetical protein
VGIVHADESLLALAAKAVEQHATLNLIERAWNQHLHGIPPSAKAEGLLPKIL